MGRGDTKTARGKIFKGSSGKTRPKGKTKKAMPRKVVAPRTTKRATR